MASPGKNWTDPHLYQGLGAVAHTCYPNTWENTNRKIVGQAAVDIN
jgi:hypothetical protein